MTSDSFTIKQNDRQPYLRRNLRDSQGNPIGDLTGKTVMFTMIRMGATTKKVDAPAVVVDGPTADVEYQWQVGDTDTPGVYQGDWKVDPAGAEQVTVPNANNMRVTVISELG